MSFSNTLDPLRFSQACELLDLLGPHITLAGGWVRDALNGDMPRDIDVFVASGETLDLTLVSLSAEAFDVIAGTVRAEDMHVQATDVSFCNGVLSVTRADYTSVHGYQTEVQIIEVEHVLKHIEGFDAYCNMLYLDEYLTVRGACVQAVEHARKKVWQANPSTHDTDEVLKLRAGKFEARGYTIIPLPAWVRE